MSNEQNRQPTTAVRDEIHQLFQSPDLSTMAAGGVEQRRTRYVALRLAAVGVIALHEGLHRIADEIAKKRT